MKIVISILFVLLTLFPIYAQLTVELRIENQTLNGGNFEFDLYLRRSVGTANIYLAASDFRLTFNSANFSGPTFVRVPDAMAPGACTFVPTSTMQNDIDDTRDLYYNNSSPTIVGSLLIINLAGPVINSQIFFDENIASINGSALQHRLGRFRVTGHQNGLPDLQWATSGLFPIVFSFENVSPWTSSQITVNAIPPDAVLPVELLDFQAEIAEKNMVLLNWRTASESENEGFDIQRSSKEDTWQIIGNVPGNGTNNQLKEYQFFDQSPRPGENFYRLQQNDFDGTVSFSPIVSIRFERPEVILYPNPSADILQISGHKRNQYRITNGQGILKKEGSLIGNHLNINDLPSGIYFLYIDHSPIKFLKW